MLSIYQLHSILAQTRPTAAVPESDLFSTIALGIITIILVGIAARTGNCLAWGFFLIALRLAIANAALNYPNGQDIYDFVTNKFIRNVVYLIAIGLFIFELARYASISALMRKLKDEGVITGDLLALVIRLQKDNPKAIAIVNSEAELILLKRNHQEESTELANYEAQAYPSPDVPERAREDEEKDEEEEPVAQSFEPLTEAQRREMIDGNS